MNCINHPEVPAVAYCRACGKAVCQNCQRTAQGTVYCQEHLPAEQPFEAGASQASYSPYTAPPPPPYTAAPTYAPSPGSSAPNVGVSPGLAFILGLIPGVGAIYNGQYGKGLLHALIFGGLISIGSSGGFDNGSGPLLGLMVAAWYFYMPFEAYHTAKKRQLGQAVDEFSSLFPMRGKSSRFPVGPVILIAVGALFLLNNLGWLRFYDVARYWPIFLIALGAYMLYARLSGVTTPVVGPEAANEQR